MENQLNNQEACNCNDPGCCQPKPRNRWQKWVFFAVILLAAGIITYKLFYSPSQAPACNPNGCGGDTTQCCDTSQNTDIK
jgi:hypothetical protein